MASPKPESKLVIRGPAQFERATRIEPAFSTWVTDCNSEVVLVALDNVMRYISGVLLSFGDKTTERVWQRESVRSFDQNLLRSALRKLLILDAAELLADLTVPPGNRLERLRGDRAGQHSIRINQQWRICFRWTAAGPEDVVIVDYH
jgi:proteic killer suppression protein